MVKQWKWYLFCVLTVCTVLLTVQFGSRSVSAMAESRPVQRSHCVIIDPGHGGEDGGAVSVSGQPESFYNLAIGLQLQDLLQLLGYKTKIIRTEDISVYTRGETLSQKKASDLKERVRTANETDGAVLLSIHQNHFPDSSLSGAQVFYAKTPGSEILAKQMQELFATSINPGSRRQIKKADGIYLMTHIHCPGVLIECGFLSNPQEEQMLRAPEYQKKLSAVIAAAVSGYLSNT